MIALRQAEATTVRGGGNTLGEVVAAYRRRQREPRRAVPWSQDELAFAIGTSQAHISRIEANLQRPQYTTLVRICHALGLSQAERSQVLALAGYDFLPPLPDARSVNRVLSKLSSFLEMCPYPAVLLDEGERTWYVNELFASVWGECFGATDQASCMASRRGRRPVESIFDPQLASDRLHCWRAYYEDVDHLLMRLIALFWRAHHIRPDDLEMNSIIGRLKLNREFLVRWEQLELGGGDARLFADDNLHVLNHPRLGRLRLHAWRTRAALDDRFIVAHMMPADRRTSQVISRLTQARFTRNTCRVQPHRWPETS